jgi:hypothetical protein
MKTPSLRNAVEMSEQHEKFDAPPHKARFNLKVGDSVKVCAVFDEVEKISGERFWVIITSVKAEGRYQGMVNNQLVHSALHGLAYRDFIVFEDRHIYDVVPLAKAAEMNRQAQEEKAQPGFKNESLKAYDENRPLPD